MFSVNICADSLVFLVFFFCFAMAYIVTNNDSKRRNILRVNYLWLVRMPVNFFATGAVVVVVVVCCCCFCLFHALFVLFNRCRC